jgi:FOG: TPR repeat
MAYAGVADAYSFMACLLGSETVHRVCVCISGRRASARDRPRAAGGAHIAGIHQASERLELAEAEREFRRALELDPTQTLPRLYHSWLMVLQGDSAGAIIEARRAQEIEPLSPLVNAGTAHTLFLARRYDQAVTECEKSLEVDPNFIFAIHVMGMCRAQQARLTEAIDIGERTVLMSGRAPFYLGVLGTTTPGVARATRCATFLKNSRALLIHGTFRRIASSTSMQGRTTSTEHSSGRPRR